MSLNDRVAAHGVAGFGPASSIRPELTAIVMALEDSPDDEERTLLTDSESSMKLPQSMQRRGSTATQHESCFKLCARRT